MCALLQIYEVGLSPSLREQSQEVTCVHAKAPSGGITRPAWASPVLQSHEIPAGEAGPPDPPSPRPWVFPGGWAGSWWDRQRFTIQRIT